MSRKDYDAPVEVDSGDEFEDLADAFNAMSARVSHQLATQKSMSEIDQLILSRIKKEDIVQIVLERTHRVLPAELIAMRSVKLYADGALGSRGAALIEPYSDDPGNRGLLIQSAEELARLGVGVSFTATGAGAADCSFSAGVACNSAASILSR